VAEAFRTAAATLEAHTSPADRVGIAFPDTPQHRDHLGRIKTALQKLGIAIFWVDEQGVVSVES
jgi:hypothetical protein